MRHKIEFHCAEYRPPNICTKPCARPSRFYISTYRKNSCYFKSCDWFSFIVLSFLDFSTRVKKIVCFVFSPFFSNLLTCRGSWGPKCKHWRRQWRWWDTEPSCTKSCQTARTVARNQWRWMVYKKWRTIGPPRPDWWSGCWWSISCRDSRRPRWRPVNYQRARVCRSCQKISAPRPPLFSPLVADRSYNLRWIAEFRCCARCL